MISNNRRAELLQPVKHQVYENAAYRNVHPDRPDPDRQTFVFIEPLTQSEIEQYDDKGRHQPCQENVGDQYGKIERPGPAVIGIRHRTDVVVIYGI